MRVGWRALHAFTGGGKVNGIYPFRKDGETQLIVHTGGSLVRLTPRLDTEGYTETTLLTGLTDGRGQGFFSAASSGC